MIPLDGIGTLEYVRIQRSMQFVINVVEGIWIVCNKVAIFRKLSVKFELERSLTNWHLI
jgi:hypothetical protein